MFVVANDCMYFNCITHGIVVESSSLRLNNCRLERRFSGEEWLPLCYTTSFTLQRASYYCQRLGYSRTSNYYSNHTIAQ